MGRPISFARTITLVVSAVYSIILFALGFQLPDWWRFAVAFLPTLVILALVAWDLWLWRLPGVQGLTRRPDLRGLWSVRLTPHPGSIIPEGGKRGSISAFLEIKQSFWTVHLRLYTDQSASSSNPTNWLPSSESAVENLTFTYENTPRVNEAPRSTRSVGTCKLVPTSLKPSEVEGSYFTDRFTKGDMALNLIGRTTGFPSYRAASKYVNDQESPK